MNPPRPMHALRTAATLAALLAATSCAGYRFGGAKPAALAGVKTIAVPVFANNTLEPRVEVLATNATVTALSVDGTYRLAPAGQADAILHGTVDRIEYRQLRSRRVDTLRPTELGNEVVIDWELKDGRDPTKVLDHGTVRGTSRLFLGDNVQTARTNALPDAVRNAANSLASRLADGF
jgi:hypothetical protein